VWNAWKAKLLEDLFHARAPADGGSRGAAIQDSVQARQLEAQRLLRLYAVPDGAEQACGASRHAYFQRHTRDEIAWHARHLYWRVNATSRS
jgi:[protein-PII] uridylyltransferase